MKGNKEEYHSRVKEAIKLRIKNVKRDDVNERGEGDECV
jgi:hypothetical protein